MITSILILKTSSIPTFKTIWMNNGVIQGENSHTSIIAALEEILKEEKAAIVRNDESERDTDFTPV